MSPDPPLSPSLPPIEIAPHRPAGFNRLVRREADAGKPGCALLLALPTGIVGFGALWLYFSGHADDGEGPGWIVPVVGFAFAAVALLLLYAGLRGMRGRSIPLPEVSLEKGIVLRPGARGVVRVRQPGPARFAKLTVKAVCERRYRRPVGKDGESSVEDIEPLWSTTLFEIVDQPIARGLAVERDLELRLPHDARPTGPAQPEGEVRWAIEVWGEGGFLRATYHPFVLTVQGRSDTPA